MAGLHGEATIRDLHHATQLLELHATKSHAGECLLARLGEILRVEKAEGELQASLALAETWPDLERPAVERNCRLEHPGPLILLRQVVGHEWVIWEERDGAPVMLLPLLLTPRLEHPCAEHVVGTITIGRVGDGLPE